MPPNSRRTWIVTGGVILMVIAILAMLVSLTLPAPGLPRSEVKWDESGRFAVVVASNRYGAGNLHRALMGPGYRDLWATPIRVPVLDLSTAAGGLTPRRLGGGRQTRSLHLDGRDGRDYVFRTVDKDQANRAGRLRRTVLGRMLQDEVAALHPGAGLVAAALADAAGVLHAQPFLAVMPDVPELGEFREEFAGMLGTLEEAPDDGSAAFAGSHRILSTEDLWSHLAEQPGDSVDSRSFLTARLLDIYLGDWDRHEDQWRWARPDDDGSQLWVPIPRDRDYALSNYRGVLPAIARIVDPKVVRFDGEYRDLEGLMEEARTLDGRLLCGLTAADWDSVAQALHAKLGNQAIDDALLTLPIEYRRADKGFLLATLRARRDGLPRAAQRFRELVMEAGCDPREQVSPIDRNQ